MNLPRILSIVLLQAALTCWAETADTPTISSVDLIEVQQKAEREEAERVRVAAQAEDQARRSREKAEDADYQAKLESAQQRVRAAEQLVSEHPSDKARANVKAAQDAVACLHDPRIQRDVDGVLAAGQTVKDWESANGRKVPDWVDTRPLSERTQKRGTHLPQVP